MRTFLLLFLFLFSTSLLSAKTLTFQEKMVDFRQVVDTMRVGYGPLEYKKELGIDLDWLEKVYEFKILRTNNNRDFYYLMIQFIAEFKDSHFGGSLPNYHVKKVPFSVEWVQGKPLIVFINKEELDEKKFPFAIGDEIISVDGVPTEKVLKTIKSYINAGYEETAQKRAAWYLTLRSASRLPVPEGKSVTFTIKHGATSEVESVTLDWEEEGRAFDENSSWGKKSRSSLKPLDYNQLSIDRSEFDLFKKIESNYQCSGKTRIAIPADAVMLMEKPFVAYYHNTPKGAVGYLRIPHYFPENEYTGTPEYELRLAQYQYVISILEQKTVGLIIDQDHNCGGSVDFLHNMAGLFMDKPFTPIKFSVLTSKESYFDMKSWQEEAPANTLTHVYMDNVLAEIEKGWKEDRFLTAPLIITGQPYIPNNHIHYTKPIIMLIDEMSGSGGDAFPALLQGLGRAKLLGTRTMGAGGHVIGIPALHYSQIKVNMTKSLFYRPSGVPIENNGTTPDIPYTITKEDIQNSYKPYQTFYLAELMKLL